MDRNCSVHFPRWQFSAADTVAATWLHSALLIGRDADGPHVLEWETAFQLCDRSFCDGRVMSATPRTFSTGPFRSCAISSACWHARINPVAAGG